MEIEERIAQIREEIRTTPYHKGTQHHIGRLRGRIAQLEDELIWKSAKGGSGGGGGYAVKKTGDATVVLVGPPSVGKSTLINQITNARSKVATYDFTTIDAIPGMMDYRGAHLQIMDIPGIISGAAQGKGRGKQVLSVARNADLILIMVDAKSLEKIETIKAELYQFGIRLDETPPPVYITKLTAGGLKVSATVPLRRISLETVQELAGEFKIRNGEIVIKEDVTLERLIDAFMANRAYLPYLVVVNKIDLVKTLPAGRQGPLANADFVPISAQKGIGINQLKEKIWQKLGLAGIFLKPADGEADLNKPLIIKAGQTLTQILEDLSICDKETFTRAKIWGPGAKFPGQEVSFSFRPSEGTIIGFLA